jgi:hypothetical protein
MAADVKRRTFHLPVLSHSYVGGSKTAAES